ncbi:MAG: fibronectin type III domain-containing protein, partial [Candidatus Latescibacteria bacterium]|nr:fibronectin type III domain-containing protein [Candidatus Latescibacterota bacterium]
RRGKPTNLTAAPGEEPGTVVLAWDQTDDRSIPWWEYRQREESEDWGPWTRMDGSGWETTEHTVEALTNGMPYQFKVRGLNRTDLAESEVVEAMPVGRPDPPAVEATAGHEQVMLEWTAPKSNGGSPMDQYEYRYQEAGAATWELDWTAVGLNMSQRVAGLTNEQPYVFEVRAQNEAGFYSEASSDQA